jgi:hypothetical protein
MDILFHTYPFSFKILQALIIFLLGITSSKISTAINSLGNIFGMLFF